MPGALRGALLSGRIQVVRPFRSLGSRRVSPLGIGRASAQQPEEGLGRGKQNVPGARTVDKTQSTVKPAEPRVGSVAESGRSGTLWLCFVNILMFCLTPVLTPQLISTFYLIHSQPRWWQFLTNAFFHANYAHLSNNLFGLFIFGKLIEEQEGAFGVWVTFIICAIGGSVAQYLFTPTNAETLGASSAVFGMFVVSVLIRVTWRLDKIMEAAILGQFVLYQVSHEVRMQIHAGVATATGNVAHLAHLGGAFFGALLVLFLITLPEPDSSKP